VNCRACHWPNALHRRFCGGCGERLTRLCAQCDFVNTLVDRFCGGCGDTLAAPGAQLARPPPVHCAPAPVTAAPAAPLASAAPPAPPTIALAPPPAPDPGGARLSLSELSSLLPRASPAASAPAAALLPSTRVSQDDLDSLFGNG